MIKYVYLHINKYGKSTFLCNNLAKKERFAACLHFAASMSSLSYCRIGV